MNLDLTEEQAMIRDLARGFADKEVRPIADAIDRDARFPVEAIDAVNELKGSASGIRSPYKRIRLHEIKDEPALARLRDDLEDGTWGRRHAHLMSQPVLDLGYRLVIARGREMLDGLGLVSPDLPVVGVDDAGRRRRPAPAPHRGRGAGRHAPPRACARSSPARACAAARDRAPSRSRPARARPRPPDASRAGAARRRTPRRRRGTRDGFAPRAPGSGEIARLHRACPRLRRAGRDSRAERVACARGSSRDPLRP